MGFYWEQDDRATSWWMIKVWYCEYWHCTYWYCHPSLAHTMLNRAGTFMMVPPGTGCLQSSVVIWWIPGLEFWPFCAYISKSFSPSAHWTLQIVIFRPTQTHQPLDASLCLCGETQIFLILLSPGCWPVSTSPRPVVFVNPVRFCSIFPKYKLILAQPL